MQRQEKDCRASPRASGWDVVEVFKESDTSAFKRRFVDLPGGGRGQRGFAPCLAGLAVAVLFMAWALVRWLVG